MVAFQAAVDLGYRYLETDVHATSDGALVALHDDRLDGVTDGHGLVAELTLAEVRRARVAGIEPVVEFAELLAAFPAARINVDPKHDAAVPALIRLMRRPAIAERLCIGSFSDRRVGEIRREVPGSCTALAPWEVLALRAGSWGVRPLLGRLRRRPGRCVQVPERGNGGLPIVEPRFLQAAHEVGLPVHVWTINAPGDMRRLLDLGVDGLFSDRAALLRDVLADRGEWVGEARGRLATDRDPTPATPASG